VTRAIGEDARFQALKRSARKVLPHAAVRLIQRARGSFPVGSVRFGDLRRLAPISRSFGYDRGTPIDRYYIHGFLERNASDVRGRVLEMGDDRYTWRFGGSRVERSDVLCVEATNPKATFVGDLAKTDTLPEGIFDCIILTQTLQYIFRPDAAIATLFRALKPGGVLLLTVPSVKSQIDGSAWGATWYWWFTSAAVRRLLEESFHHDAVTVDAFGNILVATAFHFGLALEELKPAELDFSDPQFAIIATGRAVKLEDARAPSPKMISNA
jgi:SAM-dependent methyltransferase